jgi:hypothetical protein
VRDTPNFLYAALDKASCAPFIKERRMKFGEPVKLHRKSGIWGTHLFFALNRMCPRKTGFGAYGFSLLKTWSLEMSLNITNAAKISSTTKAA